MSRIISYSLGFPGVTRVFQELEKIGFSKHNPEYNGGFADLVILGAWDPSYRRYKELYPNAKMMVLWTSPVLQTEHSNLELEYFLEVKRGLEKGELDYIWFGSEEWMSLNLPNTFYAPYPVTLRDIPNQVEVQERNVSLLGPLSPRKNVLNQLIACSNLNVIIHVNNIPELYCDFARSLKLKLRIHKWMNEEEYYRLVASMQLGLQVSVPNVESFSYVTFDHLMMDRPCLSSLGWPGKDLQVLINNPHHPSSLSHSNIAIELSMASWLASMRIYGKGELRNRAQKIVEERSKLFNKLFKEGLESYVKV